MAARSMPFKVFVNEISYDGTFRRRYDIGHDLRTAGSRTFFTWFVCYDDFAL